MLECGAYAGYSLSAKDVNYIKPDGTTVTVSAALDELREIKTKTKELIIFDYKNGGAQYEFGYVYNGESTGPTITDECIYGNCTWIDARLETDNNK